MKEEIFDELIASVKEGGAILRGEKKAARKFHMEAPDIKQIREGYKLTQEQFAAMMGISTSTLQNWEQGRRVPEGPAMMLLCVAKKHPEAILDAVCESSM
ncbi:MAG: helix-turn-helix domain-containing protein [Chloroflexi bacterium]|nr:helix-turn-helix domain-containing protein [Chloroflexota bacterium]